MNKMLCLLSFLLPLVSAHLIMVEPPALGLKTNNFTQENDVDYSLSSPLASLSDFPCKGKIKYLGTPSGQSVATWAAGSSQSFSLQAGAPHNGGSCQASISEDSGVTWRVIKTYVGGCPSAATVASPSTDTVEPFTVPKATKNGDVVFAWTWFNNEGNREMYMNCAVVTITGGGSTAGLSSLPATFVANIGNGCTTQPNANLLFPNPGSDVTTTGVGVPPVGSCGTSGSGTGSSGSSPASSGASSASVATPTPAAGTSAPVAGTSAAAVATGAATSAVVPIASSSVPYGAGVNGAVSTSVTYNNGLYTAGAGAASTPSSVPTVMPTVVPTVISPAVSSVVSPPVNTIPGTASTPCESSIMPAVTGTTATETAAATETATTVYGTPVASGYPVASETVHASTASGTSTPDCKRSVRYTRSKPKAIPRSPGCQCVCSGGGTPQLIGQCS